MTKLERDLLRRVEILERLMGTMDTVNKIKCEACGDTIPDTDGAHRCEAAYSLRELDPIKDKGLSGDYICNYCKKPIKECDKYKHWGGICVPKKVEN